METDNQAPLPAAPQRVPSPLWGDRPVGIRAASKFRIQTVAPPLGGVGADSKSRGSKGAIRPCLLALPPNLRLRFA